MLEDAWKSYEKTGVSDGSVLKTTDNYKDGWVVLNSSLYEVSGVWDGQDSEIVVVKTGNSLTLRVIVYETLANGNRSEKGLPYTIKTVNKSSGFTKNVELSLMSTVQITTNN